MSSLIAPTDDYGQWRTINSSWWGSTYSPTHLFHGAHAQLQSMDALWKALDVPREIRHKMAADILAHWQHCGSDITASQYLDWLTRNTVDAHRVESGERGSTLSLVLSQKATTESTSDGNGVVTYTSFYPDGSILDQYSAYRDGSGKRVKHGVWVKWSSEKEGWKATFENGALAGNWHAVKRGRYHPSRAAGNVHPVQGSGAILPK